MLLILHPHARSNLTTSRKLIHRDRQISTMTLKTDLQAEEETLILELLGKLGRHNTTTSKSEDNAPSHTSDILGSRHTGHNTFSKIRRFYLELTEPSISAMEIVSLIVIGVFFFLMSREMDRRTCDDCWKQREAHALASISCSAPTLVEAPGQGTAWAIPQPGMYAMVNRRLTKIGDITYGKQ